MAYTIANGYNQNSPCFTRCHLCFVLNRENNLGKSFKCNESARNDSCKEFKVTNDHNLHKIVFTKLLSNVIGRNASEITKPAAQRAVNRSNADWDIKNISDDVRFLLVTRKRIESTMLLRATSTKATLNRGERVWNTKGYKRDPQSSCSIVSKGGSSKQL